MIRGGGWWSGDQIAAMILSAKAEAWDEGYLARHDMASDPGPENPYR